jgi:hypothetical protein
MEVDRWGAQTLPYYKHLVHSCGRNKYDIKIEQMNVIK